MSSHAERAQSEWIDGSNLDVAAAMMRLTLAIVAKALLNAEVDGDIEQVDAAVSLLVREINRKAALPLSIPFSWPTPSNRRAREAVLTLEGIIYRIIRDRRQAGVDTGDLLSMLLLEQQQSADEAMTDVQLRDEVMTIFLAGHETTANALSWAFYLLARHPDIYARLREEATSVLGGRSPRWEDLPRLGYALQIFKEALRLYPPAYVVSRRAIRDLELGGYDVARATDVIVNIYGMHRRAEYFPDPEHCDPARFEPDAEKNLPKHAYLPFGAGARVCIGNQFALMEGQIVLAALAQRVAFSLPDARVIPPDPLVTLRPQGRMRMIVRRKPGG